MLAGVSRPWWWWILSSPKYCANYLPYSRYGPPSLHVLKDWWDKSNITWFLRATSSPGLFPKKKWEKQPSHFLGKSPGDEVKGVQRWQVSWIRSKAGNNHRLQNRNQLQSAPVTQYGRQPSKVETRLLHCWALGKFHVKDSQSMPDQIMSDRRSKHAWSNCVLCIPFIVGGSPNEYWLHKCDACVIKTWRTPFKHRWPKLTNDWQLVKVSNHLQSNLKNR